MTAVGTMWERVLPIVPSLLLWMLISSTVKVQSIEILESPRALTRGQWGDWSFCPNGSFVNGMNLKIDTYSIKNKDNVGVTGITFSCAPIPALISSPMLLTAVGDWRGWTKCKDGYVTGFQTRTSDEVPCGKGDTVGMTDLKLFCSSHDPKQVELSTGIIDIGKWREKRECLEGGAICGFRGQVGHFRNHSFSLLKVLKKCAEDNVGLTNLDVLCCKVPKKLESCEPDMDNVWVDELSCDEKLACKKSFRKGIYNSKSATTTQTSGVQDNQQFSGDLEVGAYMLKTKFSEKLGHTKFHGVDVAETLSQVSTQEETIDVDMTACHGRMQQMVLKCGSIQAKTGHFRCVEKTAE